jgi:hypothetical protein
VKKNLDELKDLETGKENKNEICENENLGLTLNNLCSKYNTARQMK